VFQYHFLRDKFLINDESLQIHEHWHEHVEKTALDCGRMRIVDFILCRKKVILRTTLVNGLY